MATHSSILAWESPWTEELGGLQAMCPKELDTTKLFHVRVNTHIIFICIPPRREIVEAMLGDL